MSVRTDTVNLNINVNGNKAQNELNTLRKNAKDIAFEMQGLKKGTAEYIAKAAELKKVNADMANLKKEIGITALTQKELIAEMNKLKSLRGSVIPFSNEYKELSKSIKEVEKRLYDVKNGVQGFASFFSKIKDEVKQFGVVAAGYLGFQFITSQFQNIIKGAGKMSDQLADLQRVAGFTAAEAKNLNGQFKELNTRTSTEGLREIAIIAGKLGVAKDDIYDFTAAVDQLVVSLGDELGNAEQITSQLGKILNVFNGEISADGITKLGNAFVELANTGSATGGFIADFDQRLSGIAKSAGIGLGELSGLGAGLEEMGARVESSSTAIQKLIISIASDIPAAAKIAGIGVDKFNQLFKENAVEALLKYSEGLVKNKESFSAVTQGLADAGEEGARTIETISKLGTNADQLRKRIELGKQALQDNSAITEAFTLKNETFGATLDKLGKEFNRLATSPGITNFLQGAVEGALAFVKAIRNLPQFIQENKVAILTLVAGILLLNRQYIVSAALIIRDTFYKIGNAIATKGTGIANAIAGVSAAAYSVIISLLTGRITLATAAQRLWALALTVGLGPLGLILTLVGAVAVAFGAFGSSLKNVNIEQKAQADLTRRAADAYSDQVNSLERLKSILTSSTTSLAEKKKAQEELIKINPDFINTLTLDSNGHLKGVESIDAYIAALKRKAEVQAATELSNELFKEELEIKRKIADLENKTAGKFKDANAIREEISLNKQLLDVQKQKGFFDNIINKNIISTPTASTPTGGSNSNEAAKIATNTIAVIKAKLKELDDAYENIDISNKKALASNRAARKALQDQLDALEGKKPSGQKAEESEFKRLQKEAEKYYQYIRDLKKRIDKGEDPEQQEIQRATQKYEEILLKAKNFYIKKAIDGKRFNEEERIIAEEQQRELNEIFQKYFKKRMEEQGNKEYEDSLVARREYSDQLKIQAAKDFADGKITKKQYEAELKTIERNETKDRVIIAQDYASTVKKAQTDLKGFRKSLEQETTNDIIAENEKRKADAGKDKIAIATRKVLTTRPDTKARLDAEKELLKLQHEQEIEAADLTHEELLAKEAEYQQAVKDLDNEFLQGRINQVATYVGYVQQALTSLNQVITNRENAQFNKEKALNQKKRKELKSQLDNKLISQAQYDKKMNALQEEQDAKERELKRKQAKREKALNLFRAIVNTAAGVASSLSYGGPVGIALAAITAVLGALEIAAIASQPLPEAGKGKWFTQGDKHSDASGGIPIMIERDEAVIKADAMTDNKEYLVRGTPRQITSALNSQAGGVSWAGGAVVKKANWINERPAQLNPGLGVKMADGGNLKERDNNNSSTSTETNTLLRSVLTELKENTAVTKYKNEKLHAVVSIKEFREEEERFDNSKKLSGLG